MIWSAGAKGFEIRPGGDSEGVFTCFTDCSGVKGIAVLGIISDVILAISAVAKLMLVACFALWGGGV